MRLWQQLKNWYNERSGSYSFNFARLVCGTASAQAISFITLPILTRMYAVGDFGTQALYLSTVSILVIVVTGRYELAILLPKEDDDSFALVILTLLLAAIGCLFCEVIVCGLLPFLQISWLNGEISSWLPFLAITIFVQVNYNVWYTWLNRNRAYKMMSRMAVISTLVNFLAAFIYGYYTNAESHGLLLNTFAGLLCCTMYILYYCRKKDILPYKQISRKKIINMTRRYKRFPRFLVLGHILNTGSTQLPFFILQGIGGQELVGIFSMVQKLLHIPISLIGSAMGNVFRREASEAWNKKRNCWAIYKKTLWILLILGLVPFSTLFFFAADLVPFFLGGQWREVGLYIVYLCPMFYMSFVSSPLSSMSTITEKMWMGIFAQSLRFIIIYASMMIAFSCYGSGKSAIVGYGIAFTIYYIWSILVTQKWAKGESYF